MVSFRSFVRFVRLFVRSFVVITGRRKKIKSNQGVEYVNGGERERESDIQPQEDVQRKGVVFVIILKNFKKIISILLVLVKIL